MTSGRDIKPSQAPFSIYHFRCVALMQQIMAVKCREILPCFLSQLNTHSPCCSDRSLRKNRCALAGEKKGARPVTFMRRPLAEKVKVLERDGKEMRRMETDWRGRATGCCSTWLNKRQKRCDTGRIWSAANELGVKTDSFAVETDLNITRQGFMMRGEKQAERWSTQKNALFNKSFHLTSSLENLFSTKRENEIYWRRERCSPILRAVAFYKRAHLP